VKKACSGRSSIEGRPRGGGSPARSVSSAEFQGLWPSHNRLVMALLVRAGDRSFDAGPKVKAERVVEAQEGCAVDHVIAARYVARCNGQALYKSVLPDAPRDEDCWLLDLEAALQVHPEDRSGLAPSKYLVQGSGANNVHASPTLGNRPICLFTCHSKAYTITHQITARLLSKSRWQRWHGAKC
jgi:hypothetical protein